MNFSPDGGHGNRRPEIRLRNAPERQLVHRPENRWRKTHTWKIPLWSKLILLPYFQQFPDLGLPCFQLGNVVLVNVPSAVDAAANLVDVRGGTADGGSQILLLGVIDLDYAAVNQHLAGVCAEIVRPQLAHFVLDEIQFLLVQADFFSDGARAIRHEAHPFRCSPKAPSSSRISR